jgi:hypothetical protein
MFCAAAFRFWWGFAERSGFHAAQNNLSLQKKRNAQNPIHEQGRHGRSAAQGWRFAEPKARAGDLG